jgi:hypothetical protein
MRFSFIGSRCGCRMFDGGLRPGAVRKHLCAWGCPAHGPCWCRGSV